MSIILIPGLMLTLLASNVDSKIKLEQAQKPVLESAAEPAAYTKEAESAAYTKEAESVAKSAAESATEVTVYTKEAEAAVSESETEVTTADVTVDTKETVDKKESVTAESENGTKEFESDFAIIGAGPAGLCFLNELMNTYEDTDNYPTIYIFEKRDKYIRKHVLLIGGEGKHYNNEKACDVLPLSAFGFNTLSNCKRDDSSHFSTKAVITHHHETFLYKLYEDKLKRLGSRQNHIKFIKINTLTINTNDGTIDYIVKGSNQKCKLSANTIIGADGKHSIVQKCIPNNELIDCKDICKFDEKTTGRRFGSVYILTKPNKWTPNTKMYTGFKTTIYGYQNRYRIFNTPENFLYIAFQLFEEEVNIEKKDKITVKPSFLNIIKRYITFLTGIRITQEIARQIEENKSKVFEIKPGYHPRFFHRNGEQRKNYLLIGDAAVHVDFFSGHGIDNATQTSKNFINNLHNGGEHKFELKNMSEFEKLCKKVQLFNCWKHKTSTLRKPVNFDKNRFQQALKDFYKTTEGEDEEVKQFFDDLGVKELKVLFNPMNDTHGVTINNTKKGHSFKNIKDCFDNTETNSFIKNEQKEVMDLYWEN